MSPLFLSTFPPITNPCLSPITFSKNSFLPVRRSDAKSGWPRETTMDAALTIFQKRSLRAGRHNYDDRLHCGFHEDRFQLQFLKRGGSTSVCQWAYFPFLPASDGTGSKLMASSIKRIGIFSRMG